MSDFLERIRTLVQRNEIRISEHGYDELANDGITVRDVVEGSSGAQLVEEYPDYPKGHCALALEKDRGGDPIHVVWGIPRGHESPAVLVTAYRPVPELWTDDFLRRRR